jgi:threonine/homoserine/homoserine lactone efflux protein
MENLVNWIFVAVTAVIAMHGLTYRSNDGERPWLHLLFGSIALLFCIRVLFADILGLWG